jgi:TRAP-type C4-dicarboxylate transport system permease small subunit
MIKKIIGYILVIIGFLCFLFVGGGSMRYRNTSAYRDIPVSEGITLIVFIILIPIIGFFLVKIGFKIIGKKDDNNIY